jgi:hypothetical protein
MTEVSVIKQTELVSEKDAKTSEGDFRVWEVYLKYKQGQYFQGRIQCSSMERAIEFCESFDFSPYPWSSDMELNIYEWEIDNPNSGNLVYVFPAPDPNIKP